MNTERQKQLAQTFRRMHEAPPILLLPNAWDAMSARAFEAEGFNAIATTSGGVAWALGYPDGEKAPWREVVSATERVARTVRVPVTADIEGGYSDSLDQLADNVEDIIRAGAVGINLEDGRSDHDHPIRRLEDAVDRIRAARDRANTLGVPVVINARVDVYQKHIGEETSRFEETLRRARAYLAAGADCVFPIGLSDLNVIANLVTALKAPINVVGRNGMPPIATLEKIGVARVSTASGPALAVLAFVQKIGRALRRDGTFDVLAPQTPRADTQKLFAARPD
ncbi:MAG TPA: isocitrate lyase/phosphoenolpyruvate mutase family protein [Alphaproteobacteria bacterium]|jgi:2-methylisocitrate lyase-like PEP mutase family enzyme|nr:isocitrate lyase/phosphoenolpyruvate mutase family protein [Alphaproteobacteria bacterium]